VENFNANVIFFIFSVCLQFKPLEQLMGVFPAASKKHLPITWQRLMCDPVSRGQGSCESLQHLTEKLNDCAVHCLIENL
jgi:hypothetical protein